MPRKIEFAAIALGLTLLSPAARATTCSYTYLLSNGTPADATQVMHDFNDILSCANSNLAPLASPSFTGSVGIGTASPETSLVVNGTLETANQGRFQGWYTNGTGPALETGFIGGSAEVVSYNRTTAAYQPLLLEASSHHFTIGGSEKVTITGAGNVGIGTASPAVALAVVGYVRTGTSGTDGCVQNFAGTGIAGTCTSDAALKTVKGNVHGVLDKLANLQLVQFYWNKTAAAIYRNSTTALNTGYIAQSVQQQFPELVSTDAHGYRQLDYTTLSLYGLEAVKELRNAVDTQARAAESQQSEIAALIAANRSQAAAIRLLQTQIIALQRKGRVRTAAN